MTRLASWYADADYTGLKALRTAVVNDLNARANQLRPVMVRFPVVQHDFPAIQRRNARSPVQVRVVTTDSRKVG